MAIRYNSIMPITRLYFLGTPKLELDDVPADITSVKSIALLALLAMQREPLARERILGMLWAESADDAARKNLRNALWSIRKALGEDVIRADDDHLSLGESVWVDAREMERIADSEWQIADGKSQIADVSSTIRLSPSAIALYRGEFLDGIALSDAPEFELWLTGIRERLAQAHLRLLAALVEQQRARADWREVITTARRALAHDNLQEPMYRALMHAHAQLGERAEALREYDALRAALERELGVAPLPETDALRDAIVAGTIRASEPPQPSPRARISRAAPLHTPLVGRRVEMDTLSDEWNLVQSGHTRVAIIVGELGIGKSRLWQEWSSTSAGNALVLETRCLDSTQSLPFAPLTRLFDRADLARRLFTPASPVAPTWLAEAARLLPGIRANLPSLPTSTPLSPEEECLRLFEALAQLLLALKQPLVMFVDDAHWADRASLDWLGFLTHRLADQPLLLVIAYRPEDAPAALSHVVARWAREGIARRLALARLTPAECAALTALLGGDPGSIERAQTQSAGNPYFLIELLRAAPNDIPPALGELVRARLAALPDAAQQIAQAAAVLESDFDLAMLRRTSGRDEEETLQALDVLLNANILVERQNQYEFAHPLVAAITREGIHRARRAFLHRRAAETLASVYGARVQPVAGRLAAHYTEANDPPRAARFAEIAAEHALALGAPDQAAQFYRQALANEPTPERQLGLGRVLQRQGELAAARASFEVAKREYERAGNLRGAARAQVNIAETYFPAGQFAEGQQALERALKYMDTDDDPLAHAMAHLMLGTGPTGNTLQTNEIENHLLEATRHAQEHNLPEIAARGQFALGNQRAERGNLRGALDAYTQSITFARAAGNDYQEILGHNNLAYHALLLGELDTAREHVAQGFAPAEARALRVALQYLHSTRGEIALAEKRWQDAEDDFRRGLVITESLGNHEQAASYRANLALVARGRGDLDAALIALEEARDAAARLNAPHLQAKIELWLAEVYAERGERAAFEEALARAEARLKDSGRGALQDWARRLREDKEVWTRTNADKRR
ncbi:MAG: AAA family ATPase [Chloroflexi bacterium]|nr:AAA family ATPase [Chloroflexota bacterium]